MIPNEGSVMKEINLKLEKEVNLEPKIIQVPYIIITSPYALVSDFKGTRNVLIVSRKKLLLYWIYKITGIKWFLNQYTK